MPTKTGYWIRVKNGKVTDVWDYKPSDDKLAAEPGWREAVEIMPDLVANREIITTHQINIDLVSNAQGLAQPFESLDLIGPDERGQQRAT